MSEMRTANPLMKLPSDARSESDMNILLRRMKQDDPRCPARSISVHANEPPRCPLVSGDLKPLRELVLVVDPDLAQARRDRRSLNRGNDAHVMAHARFLFDAPHKPAADIALM